MEKAPGLLAQALMLAAAVAVGYGAAVLLLSLDHAPQAPAVTGKDSTSSLSSQPAALSHPLDYVATIKDCLPSGRECSRDRFYFRKEAQ